MESPISNEHSVEIWGGVECTIARLQNSVHDQLEKSGHESRLSDFNLFSDLGIKKIRYPLLWEKYELEKDKFLQLHMLDWINLKSWKFYPLQGYCIMEADLHLQTLLIPIFPNYWPNMPIQLQKTIHG